MGDLADDTAVQGGEGRYTATLSSDWEIWGPNGGYVAAVLLRAAGAHSEFPRPATLACHFLGVADFAPVDIEVLTLRRGRRSESVRTSMTQDGRPVAEALIWTVDDTEGPEHDWTAGPEAPEPTSVPSFADRLREEGEDNPFRFWDNLEYRPLAWKRRDEWECREPSEPRTRAWYRFQPTATFDDRYVDAARSAIIVDTMMWPAATWAHREPVDFMAPSMDVTVTFHAEAPTSEFLFGDTVAPISTHGLIGARAEVWSQDGRLLASGTQQMLIRSIPSPHRRDSE